MLRGAFYPQTLLTPTLTLLSGSYLANLYNIRHSFYPLRPIHSSNSYLPYLLILFFDLFMSTGFSISNLRFRTFHFRRLNSAFPNPDFRFRVLDSDLSIRVSPFLGFDLFFLIPASGF